MIGRRVGSIAEIEQPGDYCGPIRGYTGDKEACFFIAPLCTNAETGHHMAHVTFPAHTYRECPDGSLEIRASILLRPHNCRGSGDDWHGYLDEGHVWREV